MLFWGILAAAIVLWVVLNALLAIGIGRAVRIAETKRVEQSVVHALTASTTSSSPVVTSRDRAPISAFN